MMKKINILRFGICNAISAFAVYPLAALAVINVVRWNIFTGSVVPGILFFFIIFLSPLSCILGIIQGIRGWKMGKCCAAACFILSVIGLLLFAVVTYFIWYTLQGSWLMD